MQGDIFDQIIQPSKGDIFDQVSGDIFDKISEQKPKGGLYGAPVPETFSTANIQTRAILGTAGELVTSQVPGAKYLTEEGRKELKGDFFPTGITTNPEKLKDIEKELITGVKRVSPYESLSKEAMSALEWAVFPKVVKTVGEITKGLAGLTKPTQKIVEFLTKSRKLSFQVAPKPISKPGKEKLALQDVDTGEVYVAKRGQDFHFQILEELEKKGFKAESLDAGSVTASGEYKSLDRQSHIREETLGKKPIELRQTQLVMDKEGVKEPSLESLEATVKGGQVGPLPKYAEKSSINLERLETTDDVKHFINDLTIEQEAKIGKRRIGWEETRQKAEELGWNVDELKQAFQRKKAFTAAEIEATRQVNINAITDLHTMLKTIPAERTAYTPEMRAKLLDALDSVRITSQVSSEAGRALNIHKKILARDEQFKEISQMNRVLKVLEGKGIKRTDDVLDALKKIDFNNPAEVNRFVYNVTKTKFQKLSDVGYEIWINGLLSNPLTHIVNTTSNTLTLMGQYPERLLGAGIEKGRAALGILGDKTQERFIGETGQDAFSVIQGLKNGIKRFFDTMKTGRMTESKLETHVSALAPTVQKFMPARALGAEDELFKGFIQNAELNRLAYRKATQEGLKGKIKADRIIDLLSNPTEEMLEASAHQAKYLTYQQELGKVGSWVMRGRDTVPGLKYFVPFVRTPANIIKYALERTPANIPRIVYKTARGELSRGQLSEDVAKVLTGSMVGFGSYLMAKEGYITGGGPKNPAERDELFRTGWLPYAVKVGDKYYSFARLEPLASILGISADFAELEKHMKEDEKMNVASAIGSSISKNFTSKTFMQGFSNVNDVISDPGRFGEKFVQNLGASAIPAVSGGVTRAIDPEIREAKGILDTIRSRIPGVSTGLSAKIDVWGNPIERPSAPLPRFLSPVQVSQTKGDPIDIELTNLKLNLGMPPKKIKGIELEPNEYRQMVIDAGRIAKPDLNKLIQEPWYKKLTNEEKEKEIRKIMGDARDDARDNAFIKIEKRLAKR